MPKRQRNINERFQAGEPVPTQELAAQYEEKPAGVEFVAFAAFDYGGLHYEAGDPFAPGDLVHTEALAEFRGKQAGKGVAFLDLQGRSFVLPVR